MAKLNPSGSTLWALSAGSTGSDFGGRVALDSTGKVIVVGDIGGHARFGAFTESSRGMNDLFVWKLRQPN